MATFCRLPGRVLNRAVLPQLGFPTRAMRGLGALGKASMDLRWLRLLRTYADTGGLKEPQRERARTHAHGNRRPRQQAPGHDANGFAGQKAQFSQAPS